MATDAEISELRRRAQQHEEAAAHATDQAAFEHQAGIAEGYQRAADLLDGYFAPHDGVDHDGDGDDA